MTSRMLVIHRIAVAHPRSRRRTRSFRSSRADARSHPTRPVLPRCRQRARAVSRNRRGLPGALLAASWVSQFVVANRHEPSRENGRLRDDSRHLAPVRDVRCSASIPGASTISSLFFPVIASRATPKAETDARNPNRMTASWSSALTTDARRTREDFLIARVQA